MKNCQLQRHSSGEGWSWWWFIVKMLLLCQWCRQRCLCLSRVDLLNLHPVWPCLSLQFPAWVWWLLPDWLADSHQDNLLPLLSSQFIGSSGGRIWPGPGWFQRNPVVLRSDHFAKYKVQCAVLWDRRCSNFDKRSRESVFCLVVKSRFTESELFCFVNSTSK